MVKFVGSHHKTNKPRIGVQLDRPTGKNNGTVDGHKYFTAKNNHGGECEMPRRQAERRLLGVPASLPSAPGALATYVALVGLSLKLISTLLLWPVAN